jgi:hypothetical protein
MKKLILLSFFLLLCFAGLGQGGEDTSLHKNSIKIDLIPLYYDFFDYRDQIRAGFEYERFLSPRSSLACALDAGLFDKYIFIKYYDFFNQQGGMYSVKRDVKISGFHLMPGYNYYFLRSKKNPMSSIAAGGIIDFHYYLKKLNTSNSQTSEETSNTYNQTTMGAGIGIAATYGFGSHWFIELKTYMLAKIFNTVSLKTMEPIKPLNAQWTAKENDLWWFSNIKIGYAFR